MRKQGKSRNVLSPIMDECTEPEPKPWAITQQHGRNMQKSPSKGESRTKIENKTKEGESKGKKSAESNKITLPVLGTWLQLLLVSATLETVEASVFTK